MDKKRTDSEQERQSPPDTPDKTAENVEKAHRQADRDMAADAELTAHSPNDDLDEEESASLGENNTGLI